jgi:Flp pilus assembly protein CpaB
VYLVASQPAEEETGVDQGDVIYVKAVVASRDLRLGDLIHNGDVQIIDIPVEYLPRDAVTNVEGAIGQFIKTDIIQGEMILEHNLADPTNVNHDIAYVLSEDHVLMAFPAEDLMSKLSVIQRGDVVDLFVSITQTVQVVGETELGAGEEESTTITFDSMQRVDITALVVDIVQAEDEQQTTFSTEGQEQEGEQEVQAPDRSQIDIEAILLALDPQDALVLKHLVDQGAKFDIVIRAPASEIDFELDPVTSEFIKELYGLEIIR